MNWNDPHTRAPIKDWTNFKLNPKTKLFRYLGAILSTHHLTIFEKILQYLDLHCIQQGSDFFFFFFFNMASFYGLYSSLHILHVVQWEPASLWIQLIYFWILNGQKEVGLQMVQISKGIWNREAQPFEIWTNGRHFFKKHSKSVQSVQKCTDFGWSGVVWLCFLLLKRLYVSLLLYNWGILQWSKNDIKRKKMTTGDYFWNLYSQNQKSLVALIFMTKYLKVLVHKVTRFKIKLSIRE